MREPAADGVIVTCPVQDEEGARVAAQLFEEEKSEALAPTEVRLVRATGDVLMFWIVTYRGLDATPTVPIGKVSSEGVISSDGGAEGTSRMRKSGGVELSEG